MAGPETKVKVRVKKTLKSYGAYQHWPVQTGYGAACLDCHGCYKGHYFAIETKAPGKHPTPRQVLTIEDIENAGGKVFVIGEAEDRGPENFKYSGMRELERWLNAQREITDDSSSKPSITEYTKYCGRCDLFFSVKLFQAVVLGTDLDGKDIYICPACDDSRG